MLANPVVVHARRDTVRPLGGHPARLPRAARSRRRRELIGKASFPLIITSGVGRNPEAIGELEALAQEFTIPVVQTEARDYNMSTGHPMNLGFETSPWLGKADVIVVLESVVPWIPRAHAPRKDAKVIHISSDPLASRFPFREMEADLLIAGDPAVALTLLRDTLSDEVKAHAVEARRKLIAPIRADQQAKRQKLFETVKDQTPIHPAWLAHCLNQVKSEDAIVVSELGVPLAHLNMTKPRSFMGSLLSGGLGFGMGAGLGAKLAAPEREVIVAVGDGSYMFGNPVSYHYVGRSEKLPTLTIVANNHSWHAVRQSTLDVFPEGHAAKANIMPLTRLDPSPDFEKVVETCGGKGEKVEGPDKLRSALERSLKTVSDGTPVTLNVMTQARR